MSATGPIAPLLVSAEAVASQDPYDALLSNIEIVNDFSSLLGPDEVSAAALISYYTDFYQAQMNNGGFAQFAYNSGCSDLVFDAVATGLEAMEAPRQAMVFAQARAVLATLTEDEVVAFLESDLFGDNDVRDRLNAAGDAFSGAEDDLVIRNTAWLLSQPDLIVLPEDEIPAAIEAVFAGLPDRAEREAALEEAPQPVFVLQVAGLAERAGLIVDRITAGEPDPEGIKWYFVADKGLFYIQEQGDDTVLFNGDTDEEVTRESTTVLLDAEG